MKAKEMYLTSEKFRDYPNIWHCILQPGNGHDQTLKKPQWITLAIAQIEKYCRRMLNRPDERS